MRQFKFEGDTLTLTEGQYWKLLNRFDEGFAEAYPRPFVEDYVIYKPCICEEFNGCEDCPLSAHYSVGCFRILDEVMKIDSTVVNTVFSINRDTIKWRPHQDIRARRLLRKVYKALRRLPYIKEEDVKWQPLTT